ncbi:OLC1v1032544C2 [Oldenlandia corymbosa var. corymbosa]|nr:OLC1v1032544C2 [Oldenlandia corymbosa var. corymbosa]
MSKLNLKRSSLEKMNRNGGSKEKEKNTSNKHSSAANFLAKHMKKVYPIGLYKTSSSLSLSSLSLSLSQNSNDSSLSTDTSSQLEQKIALALQLIASPEKREVPVTKSFQKISLDNPFEADVNPSEEGMTKRCNWITKSSDNLYVQFHDECWGVPVYDDQQLFELLALSGMLMDFNWTEILRRKELFREAFGGFDANYVAKMGEKEIMDIASDKALLLAECRVRCIVDNAKCILKIVKEFGSFSSYMWNYVSYKPIINRYKYPRNVPLRSPKAEAISKDLLKRGFRFVGPVIVHSFMQAAGLTIDHLVDCFRYSECVNLAERPWRHV